MASYTVTSVRLSDDLRARYDELARRTGQSRNDLIVTAMDEYIEREMRELALIQEGIDAFEHGDYISLEDAERDSAARGMLDLDALARDRAQQASA